MPPITERRAGDPAALGGYDIRGRLGEGGQGVVYLGADDDGGQVAVKWLRPHLAGDTVAAQRFAREAAVAQRVAPFCTAKVLATGVHEDRPFIVSEYVDGPSLQQVVEQDGPRAGSGLHRLAIGTVTALAAIHQAGIVHRDFSPSNVLLGGEGPRVIDFGIARALDATSTISSMPVGTPAFMAPEQILARPAGPAADMFAWAGTIVFAASGIGPFAAESVPAIIQRVLYDEPDLTRLTGPLRDLVAACLSKDPARRPTAERVILRLLEHPTSNPQALEQAAALVSGRSPLGPPPSPPPVQQHPSGGPPHGQPLPAQPFAAPSPSGPQPYHPSPAQPPYAQAPAQPYPAQPPSDAPPTVRYPHARQSGPQPSPWQQTPSGQPPVRYGPPGGPGRPAGKSTKGWVIAVVAAGLALVATVAVVVVAVRNMTGGSAPPVAKASTAPATPTPTPVPTANLVTSALPGTSATIYEHPADPVRLTTYTVYDSGTKEWMYYARDSLSGGFQKYPDQWESILSPDGRYLAQRGKKYIDGHDSVKITDKVTGQASTVRVVRQPLSAYIQAWSRDSRRLLLNVGNPVKETWQSTGFAIVDVTTRTASVASLRESSLRGIRYGFDPAGTGVVALANDTRQQALRFFDEAGARLRHIPNVGAGIADYMFSPSGEKFVTNCPGLAAGTNCVYDAWSGSELRRFESGCNNLATWYDDDHVVCWIRPDAAGERQQVQVVDFTGRPVRMLADVPTGATNTSMIYTYTRRN
ncbi:serine/threonine protein kinase [Nonomuraea sp. LPB2021202275-12-8]|uniref:serine/threonine protein kinase n=1 Tax=Nonomuraea sp. LPB2021202275-12-8 TaxID=3120159 RepID=UPI00300D136C